MKISHAAAARKNSPTAGWLLGLSATAILCMVWGTSGFATTKTECGALRDAPFSETNPATPKQAAGIECPNPPCSQNACQIQRANIAGTTIDGLAVGAPYIDYPAGVEYQNCGAFTSCVLQGEDPPLNNPQWDESSLGTQILGSGLLSGKCGPPQKDTLGNWNLNCPATKLGLVPITR